MSSPGAGVESSLGRPAGRHQAGPGQRHRHSVRVAGRGLCALLSLGLLLGSGYAWSSYRHLNAGLQRLSVITSAGPARPVSSKFVGQDQNILIAGNDDRSNMTSAEVAALQTGRDGGSMNTDTDMLVHIPADGSSVTLISLPRDSYVAIPGYGMDKLNAAYAYGYNAASGTPNQRRAAGASLLITTVQNLTGLKIDHFVLVSMIGFYRLAQVVGGIPVNLCHAADDTVAYNQSIGSDGGSGFVMSAGHHVLTPVQALAFVRQRHNLTNGDIDRTARQRYFLTAAFRKLASAGTLLDPGKLNQLISAVDNSLFVDADLNILDLAQQLAGLSANNIVGKVLPFDHYWNASPVGDVEVLNLTQIRTFISAIVNPPKATPNVALPAPSAVQVSVLNAGASNGAAGVNAAILARAGFHTSAGTYPGNAFATTTIEYPAADLAAADLLHRYIPTAAMAEAPVAELTLVLGGDGLTASAQPPAATSSAPKPVDSGCIN